MLKMSYFSLVVKNPWWNKPRLSFHFIKVSNSFLKHLFINSFTQNYTLTSNCYNFICFFSRRALPPPPAHHASARPVLASHAAHPLPAHLQFPSHPQVASAPYGFAPLSPAKTHQYQASLWFAEWKIFICYKKLGLFLLIFKLLQENCKLIERV